MGVMKINGFTYYFKNSGVMAKNEWVNDHYYEADGKFSTKYGCMCKIKHNI